MAALAMAGQARATLGESADSRVDGLKKHNGWELR